MNRRARRTLPPNRVALLPRRDAAQRQVHLFGFVTVAGVKCGRAQNQETAGDSPARQRPVSAEDFTPSIIVQENAVDILRRVCLAPCERARSAAERRHQIGGERGAVVGNVLEPAQYRKIAVDHAAVLEGLRPPRQKWSEQRLLQRFEQPLDAVGDHFGRCHAATVLKLPASRGQSDQLYWRAGIPALRRSRAAQVFIDRRIDSARTAGFLSAYSVRQRASIHQWLSQRDL